MKSLPCGVSLIVGGLKSKQISILIQWQVVISVVKKDAEEGKT